MKTFAQYMREQIMLNVPSDPRTFIIQSMNRLSTLSPGEIADSQDVLLQLQRKINDILSGASY